MRNMRSAWLAIPLFICLLVLGSRAVDAADVEWKLFTYFGANDLPTRIDKAFAEDVTKATNGRLKITVYAAGELPYKFSDVLRAVSTNQVQMGDVAVGLNSGELPGLNVYDLPFLCTSFDDFYKASAQTHPIVAKVLRDKFGLNSLVQWTMPAQQIWFNRPVQRIDDLKGRKVRIWSRMHVDMLDRFGASGVTITAAEVTTALERRVVDGAITAAAPAYDWKFYEVAKTGYMLSFQMAPVNLVVNLAEFNKLPDDLRGVLVAKSEEWAPKYRKAVEEGEMAAQKQLTDRGESLVMPTADDIAKARTLTRPLWEKWAKDGGEVSDRLLAIATSACLH